LRRFAAALASASGLAPLRALALASHLLWFDAAGAGDLGIRTLPEWLEAMVCGRVDCGANGHVTVERPALAILDGQNGLPPLILERAGELAGEKARDVGVGLVRVAHLSRIDSAAAVAAQIAVGPMVGLLVGPGGLWSLALPSAHGLPVVVDLKLSTNATGSEKSGKTLGRSSSSKQFRAVGPPPWKSFAPWAEMLVAPGSWLVLAISIGNLEPLTTFHERLDSWLGVSHNDPHRVVPASWDARRRDVQEHGVPISRSVWNKLKQWSERLAVEVPEPTE
jgi:LDH2 family malate/lactate/ureidoglycolate dehydrogenase